MKKFNVIKYSIIGLLIFYIYLNNAFLGFIFILALILEVLILNRSSIYQLFGGIAYKGGKVNKALAWFKKASRVRNSKPGTKILYAYILLKNGEVKESGQILSALIDSDINADDKMLAKSNYALVLWKDGKLDEAVELLEGVFSSYKTTITYGSLGYFLILQGNLEKALEFNKEAYEYNSKDTVILDNLANTHLLKGNMDMADELYKKLINENPSFPEAYYNYSIVLEEKQENEKALEIVKMALKYKLSFLSALTENDIKSRIEYLESKVQ